MWTGQGSIMFSIPPLLIGLVQYILSVDILYSNTMKYEMYKKTHKVGITTLNSDKRSTTHYNMSYFWTDNWEVQITKTVVLSLPSPPVF